MPHLMESQGAVVNISSVMSTQHMPGQIAYNACKAMQDAVGFSAQTLGKHVHAVYAFLAFLAAFATCVGNSGTFALCCGYTAEHGAVGALFAHRHAMSEL